MIFVKCGASQNYIEGFHSIFGDDYDFINKIIKNAGNIFEIYDDNTFCGGLCVFDVSMKVDFEIKSGAYIYGAFICENAQGKGYFKTLCDHVCDFYQNEFYDFVLTIPAKESLFSLYEHLGFTKQINGVVSITGEKTEVILPQNTKFTDFDGDFNNLYFMHIENDNLIKLFDFFKDTISDFTIKYIEFDGKTGYAVFDGDNLIYASCDFAQYNSKKKGLLKFLTNFSMPDNILCDLLFEV